MWDTLVQMSLFPAFFTAMFVLPVMSVTATTGKYKKRNRKRYASIYGRRA